MRKVMITSLLIVLFSTTIITAKEAKQYIEELNYIDNQLSIIINSIVSNDYKDIKPIEKDLIFLESLLTSISKDIDNDYKMSTNPDEKAFIIKIDNISNDYELSAMGIRRYFSGKKDSQTFIDVVNNYAIANKDLIFIINKMKTK